MSSSKSNGKRGKRRRGRANRDSRKLSSLGRRDLSRQLVLEELEPRLLLSVSNVAISQLEEDILVNGIAGLADWADTLDEHSLIDQLLPTIGQSVGDTLDLGDLLRQGLTDPVAAYFTGDPTDPTTDELVTAIGNLNGATFDNATITLTNVSGGKSTVPGANELIFNLEFQADRSISTQASLGPEGDALGIDFSSSINADATLIFDFSFGVDLTNGLTEEQAFFIRVNSFDTEVDSSVPALSAGPMSIGFFDATLSSGNLALDANLAVGFTNPDLDPNGNLTLAELQGTPLATLASSLTDSGTASGSITATPGSLGSFSPGGTTTIGFNSLNPFVPPSLAFDAAFDAVKGFTNVSSFGFVSALEQFANWLESLGNSSVLDADIELAAETRLGDLIALDEMVADGVVAQIVDVDGVPTFATAQELETTLASALGLSLATIDADYNPATKELTYHLIVDHTYAPANVPVGIGLDLSPISEFTSASQATLNADGDLELTFGISLDDLTAVMTSTSVAPANGQISTDSNFDLNVGFGTDVAVSLTASATSDNSTRNDLVIDLNAALASAGISGSVIAGLDAGNQLTFSTTTALLGLAALELTAADYDPAGPSSSDPIVTELGFREHHFAFDSLANHAFVEGATIDGSIGLSAALIDGTASAGFLDVAIDSGSGTSTADFSLPLKDIATQTPGGRVGLFELFEAVSLDVTNVVEVPALGGALSISLPITTTILGEALTTSPELTISWPDIGSGQPTVQLTDGAELLQYTSLTGGDFGDALSAAVDYIGSLDSHPLLDHTMIGLDQTLGDLLSYAEPLIEFVTAYGENPAGALSDLATTLELALGIEPGGDDSLSLSLVENGDVIRIDLTLVEEYVDQTIINLVDPEDNANRLVDFRADAIFNIDLDVNLNLSFGIDVSNPGNYTPVIYESTNLTLGAEINVQDINLSTNIGPLGIFLVNGTLLVDADNNATTRDSAQVAIGLTDNNGATTDGRINLSALDFNNADLDVSGQVHLLLPLYFPTPPIPFLDWSFLGNVEFVIEDLGDIANTTSFSFPDSKQDEEREFALADTLYSVLNGLDYYLATTIDVLNDEVDGYDLSFIGKDLQKVGDHLEEVREEVVSKITDRFKETENNTGEALRTGLFLAVGPDGLNLLQDRTGDSLITEADIELFTEDLDQDNKVDIMDFQMSLGQDLATVGTPIDFDVGLPGLSLDVVGKAELAFGYDWELAFGISNEFGFYFITTPEDEISFQIEARTPDLQARGELGFLQIDVFDEDTDSNPNNPGVDVDQDGKLPSTLTAELVIDIVDIDLPPPPGEDPIDDGDRLRFAEVFSSAFFSQALDFNLQGVADINLDLVGSYEGDPLFPSIGAEFEMDWTFEFFDSDTPGGGGSQDIPAIAFNNVTLNAGQFITDFALPILEEVQDFTEPIQPVVDFLTTPVPLLDVFGFELTPLDVAEALGYATEVEYIEAIADIVTAINSVPAVSDSLIIPLGSYTIVEPDGNGGTQPVNLREDGDLLGAMPNITETVDPVAELHAADSAAGGFFDTLSDMGLAIPLIENPASVFRMLMAQPVDLLTYDVPALSLNFPFPLVKIGPLIPPIPLFASISGNVGAEIDLAVGFDTSGFIKAEETGDWFDVFNGFYISDRENPDGTGEDVPEATLTGRINAGAELFLVVASAGVSGGIELNLFADLVDPDGDGKVRFDELQQTIGRLTSGGGVTGAFDLSGSLTARLDAYVELLLSKRFEFNIAQFEISSFEFTDEDIFQDRFSNNNLMANATPLGAGPGLHVGGLSIESVGDEDWYEFELLRQDSVDVDVRLHEVHGSIDLEVYDSSGEKIAEGVSANDRDVASLVDVPAGTYFVRVTGAGQLNNYELAVEPGSTSQTRVFYLNPADATDRSVSYYAFSPGKDVFDGLSPRKPKASLQDLLDDYDLGVNDVVVFDTGTYVPGGSILADDSGATYIGSIDGSQLAGIDLQNSNANTFYRFDVLSASPGLTLLGSDGNVFDKINFSGLGINVSIDDSDNNLFDRSTFAGTGDGLRILGNSVDDSAGNIIRRSDFQNELTSIQLDSYGVNVVEDNTFTGSGLLGIRLPPNIPAVITGNTIGGRETGISWDSRLATVTDNDVDGNTVGIRTVVGVIGADNPPPFGALGGSIPNRVSNNETGILIPEEAIGVLVRHTDIFSNDVGIEAHGDQTQILANDIHNNELGVRTSRVVGPTAWDANQHNLIRNNTTGVEALAGAEVRYNRVFLNDVGIEVLGSSLIHHNLVYRNTGSGILLDGANNVEVVNNTLFVSSGDGFHLEGFISGVLIRNNIVSAAGGFGLHVEAESQFGYTSDYNNYFATGGGVAFQGKGFGDLYDWQVEAESDLHSLGSTVLDPSLDNPLFVDLAGDDYHTSSGSTSIDAGDPASDFSLEPLANGNRVNLGAYGNTPQATTSPTRRLEITNPNFYVDLVPTRTYDLKWESNNLSGDLDIDLIQVGVGKVGDIGTVAASAGMTTWTPGNFVSGNNTNRYQVRLTTLSGPVVVEESREPFSIPDFNPASANTFYVNDDSTTDDVFATTVGNNRNTGLTDDAPKVVMRPLVLSYSMGPGDEVRIDTGNYVHAVNLNLSSAPILFDPRVQTVSDTLITGPADLSKVARIDRANPNVGSAAIDAINSPDMTLDNLTIVGAGIGVRFREGSSNLVASDLTLSDHGIDGLSIETLSDDAQLDRLTVFNNGRNGIFVDSRLVHLKDSEVYNNTEIGIALRSIGAAVLETTDVYGNFRGIDVINPGPDQAIIGHTDWTASLGNFVHSNSEDGIFASGNTLVVANSVYENTNIGIRLEDGADASLNVVRDHTTGISAQGSSSDIIENRSFINSVTGIEASLESNVLRNVTYSNNLHGIHATQFSGVIDHNLVYSTGNMPGNASMNVEGPGVGAQVTFNTVYEPCSSNDHTTGPTTVTTEWDPQIFMEQLFPPGPLPFPVPLWGGMTMEFQEALGDLGGVFNLGPGGGTGALLSEPLPPGEVWTIDYEIVAMDLSSEMFPPTPFGIVEATLSSEAASTGQIIVENQGGVLVGSNTMSLSFEFTLPDILTTLTPIAPLLIDTTVDFSSGFGELDLLKIPTVIPASALSSVGPLMNLANGDQWEWDMDQADVTGDPELPPQHRGDTCAEVGVIVQTNSERVLLRNNAIFVEGDASLGTTVGNSIDLVVTADSTSRWDSDFNALMTDYGAVGDWAGLPAPTLAAWQGVSNDDFHSIDPLVGTVWVDPDGNDNQLARLNGDDDNFHLLSPFGQVTQGSLAPVEDTGGTELPVFLTVTTQVNPAGTVNDLSPLVDAGDPASSFAMEIPENGQFANIGHYGNTVQASNSEPEFIHLVYPIGVEQLVAGRTYDIQWRSHDLLGTVEIELVHDGIGGSVETVIDPAASNTGLYSWTIPGGLSVDTDYRIVITRPSVLQPGIDIEGETPFDFEFDVDSRPPVVLATTPSVVELAARTLADISTITVDFSENLLAPGTGSGATYELKNSGIDGIFDDGDMSDDVVFTLNVTYFAGASDADTSSVDLAIVGGPLAEDDYRLTVLNSGIADLASLNLDGTLDGGTNDYVRFFAIDKTAPTVLITENLPDPRNDGVNPLQLVFDEAVTGVGLADVRLTRDGGPNLLSGSQTLTTLDGITWSLSDVTNLTSVEGTYTFDLTSNDSDIRDLAGNSLTAGVTEIWSVDTTAPMADVVEVTPDPRSTAVTQVDVVFSEEVFSFGLGDLRFFRDEVEIGLTGSQAPTTSDNLTWTIGNLASMTAAEGSYLLKVQTGGTLVDGVGNGLTAEARDVWQMMTSPPVVDILNIAPDPRVDDVDEAVLSFNVPITGLNLADLQLTLDTLPVSLAGLPEPTSLDQMNWHLSGLAALTSANGDYEFTLTAGASGIQDLAGNALVLGDAESWLRDSVPPTAAITPIAPNLTNVAVEQMLLVFSKPVFGVDLSNLVLTRNSVVVPWTGVQTVTTSDGITWTLNNLAALTSVDGAYELTLSPGVDDIQSFPGNPLLLGAVENWVQDFTVPNVTISQVIPSPDFDGINSIDLIFSEQVSNLEIADLLLTRDGLVVPLTGSQTLTTSDNLAYTLGNLFSLTDLPGSYELSLPAIGSGVVDAAGNMLPVGTFTTWRVLLRLDLDQDDIVGGSDFLIWQRNFGLTGADPIDGDSTGDGLVGSADLDDWIAGFGTSLPPTPAVASFDGTGAANFTSLQAAHAAFLGVTESSLTFTGLTGMMGPNQFTGITFSNLLQSAFGNEGDPLTIENLDGYDGLLPGDGSYQLDNSTVYVKLDNHLPLLPFTFEFETPVARVGSFVGIGAQGAIDTLTITAYDSNGAILQSLTVQTQFFADLQNREGLWAISADAAAIAKVTILNDNPTDFGNALIIDTLEWSTTPASMLPAVASSTVSSELAAVAGSASRQFVSANLPQPETQFLKIESAPVRVAAADFPFWVLGNNSRRRVWLAELPRAYFNDRDQPNYLQAVDELFTSRLLDSSNPREQAESFSLSQPALAQRPATLSVQDRALIALIDGDLGSDGPFGDDGS